MVHMLVHGCVLYRSKLLELYNIYTRHTGGKTLAALCTLPLVSGLTGWDYFIFENLIFKKGISVPK